MPQHWSQALESIATSLVDISRSLQHLLPNFVKQQSATITTAGPTHTQESVIFNILSKKFEYLRIHGHRLLAYASRDDITLMLKRFSQRLAKNQSLTRSLVPWTCPEQQKQSIILLTYTTLNVQLSNWRQQ